MIIEKIFKDPNVRDLHVRAPLFCEREKFLCDVIGAEKHDTHLQRMAGFLLFAVDFLQLKDTSHKISLAEMHSLSLAWKESKRVSERYRKKNTFVRIHNSFVKTIVNWLDINKMLDDEFISTWSFFSEAIQKRLATILEICNAPFLKDRITYMQSWNLCKKSQCAYHLSEAAIILFRNNNVNNSLNLTEENMTVLVKSYFSGKNVKISHANSVRKLCLNFAKYLGIIHYPQEHLPYLDYLNEYEKWMLSAKGYKSETIYAVKQELITFLVFLQQHHIDFDDITLEITDAYVEERAHNLTRWSKHGIICKIRCFMRYAEAKGWSNHNVSSNMRGPQIYKYEGLPLSPSRETMLAIVKNKPNPTPTDIRNRAVLLLFVTYGIRKTELVNLRMEDILWDDDMIVFHRAKSGRVQLFPLDEEVGNAILKYILEVRPRNTGAPYVFLSKRAPYTQIKDTYKIVTDALRESKQPLTHYGTHSLRHGVATHMVNAGYAIKNVSDMLGHRMLETTGIYAKVNLVGLRNVSNLEWKGLQL